MSKIFKDSESLGKELVSHLNIFLWKWSKIAAQFFFVFFADFALQNMVETRLPDGLEASGRGVHC